MMLINWQKLAQSKELKENFKVDFYGFQKRNGHHIQELRSIDSKELDKLAFLRVIEVTNGCIQWEFRRQDKQRYR